MSAAQSFPFSIAQQKAMISADFNSTVLYLYLYVHKEHRTRARDRIIIGTSTALYFAIALNGLMNWLHTNTLFGTHGATRVEMFVESLSQDTALGQKIIIVVISFAVYLLADGLL
ncbi:hypothetical protein CPC08DRAFT_727404, partial [Agrocybe pediades]